MGELECCHPPVRIHQEGDAIVIEVVVPGARREDIRLSLGEDRLTVRGDATSDEGVAGEEAAPGLFRRVLRFPFAVLAEKARAETHDGVIIVRLPLCEPLPDAAGQVEVVEQ